MATAAASLPPSSFATGSAVVNMLRQVGLAIGVAVLIAVLGSPDSPAHVLAAYQRGVDRDRCDRVRRRRRRVPSAGAPEGHDRRSRGGRDGNGAGDRRRRSSSRPPPICETLRDDDRPARHRERVHAPARASSSTSAARRESPVRSPPTSATTSRGDSSTAGCTRPSSRRSRRPARSRRSRTRACRRSASRTRPTSSARTAAAASTSWRPPIHQGRTQQLWQVEIRRPDDHKLVARGQVRLQNIEPPS